MTETKTTKGITITVEPKYEISASRPDKNFYAFSYSIVILNQNSYPVQLLSRYWKITDALRKTKIVKGPGVIGEQPVIDPGQEHRYASWCPLTTPLGTMAGHYTMVRTLNGSSFKAIIPAFILSTDFIKN